MQHDLSSEDGFYVTDMHEQHFFSSDRFDGQLEQFQWCLPREFRLERDWGLEDVEDTEGGHGAVLGGRPWREERNVQKLERKARKKAEKQQREAWKEEREALNTKEEL